MTLVTTAGDTTGCDTSRYFAMVESGLIAADEHVELLEGLIVSSPPQSPYHSAIVHHVQMLLQSRLPEGTLVRAQTPFRAGPKSVPEPDVAVIPGRNTDYLLQYPTSTHLLVEIADSSLAQDRFTKTAIYARAGVPAYWIVNLKERSVECFTEPDPIAGRYSGTTRATGRMRLPLPAFPVVEIFAAELFLPEEAL
jgi:Uma2 family endonuclease